MRLYLYTQFLEVLYYRPVDCTTQVGMLIRDDTSFVAYAIIYILFCSRKQEVEQSGVDAPGDHLRRGTD